MVWVLLIASVISQDQPTWRYSGTWVEKRYQINGPLSVAIVATGKEKWRGKFTGVFQNQPFDYTVDFTGPPDKLTGTATINREPYTWTAQMTRNTFAGEYSSDPRRRAYVGSFSCKEP